MVMLIGLGIFAAALISMFLAWWPIFRGNWPDGNGGGIRSRYY